jgi:hypothetical protein
MQAKLRVRISLQHKREKYAVTKDDVLQTIQHIRSNELSPSGNIVLGNYFEQMQNYRDNLDFDNFDASVSIIKPSNLLDIGFDQGLEYYSSNSNEIGIATIELGTQLKDNEFSKVDTTASNYIQQAVIDKFNEFNINGLLFIFIKNNYDNTSSFKLHNDSLKKLFNKSTKKNVLTDTRENRIDVRYRFFLDNIMLIERIYPKELSLNEQIEEVLYIEMEPGRHTIKVEMLNVYNESELAITDIAIESQIIRNINDTSCSFEFH